MQPVRCLRCLHGIDRCPAPVVKLSEMLWSDEGHSVQLNSQICCFEQFRASVSTYCVCLSVGRRSGHFQQDAEGPQECVGFSHKYLDLDRRNDLYNIYIYIYSGFALLGISWLSKRCACGEFYYSCIQ